MNRIEQTYIIDATPEEVWEALTDSELIPQWSGAPAIFSPQADTEYSLWGGDIGGRIVEVVPRERLVQTWKPKDWEVDDSLVTFVLTPSDGGTQIDLVHENVQDWDYADTTEGWDIYYLGAIKRMLESRAPAKKAAAKRGAAGKKGAAKKKPAAKKASARGKKGAAKKPAAKKRAAMK